jgi:hypothetical protein
MLVQKQFSNPLGLVIVIRRRFVNRDVSVL